MVHYLRCIIHEEFGEDKRLPGLVLSIGNHSFGGTGKTPVTIAIAKHLAKQNFKVCILTRGYKRKSKEAVLLSSNDQGISVDEIGDEAFEMYQSFQKENLDIKLAVSSDRYNAGLKAHEKYGSEIFILDDGMQHLGLHKDMQIMLVNANERGFIREFRGEAEKKSDFIFITKASQDWIRRNNPGYYLKFNLQFNQDLNKILNTYTHNEIHLGIFAGTGDNEGILMSLEEKFNNTLNPKPDVSFHSFFYPDHHHYSIEEVTEVLSRGMKIITTEKDLTKVPVGLQDKFIVAKLALEFYPESILETITGQLGELLSEIDVVKVTRGK